MLSSAVGLYSNEGSFYLQIYKDQLSRLGINDDRIVHDLPRRSILARVCIRFASSLFLFSISIPGLFLWLPVFATTLREERKLKKLGPVWDTWDDIAQAKVHSTTYLHTHPLTS